MKAAIIGAGITGLTAARELKRCGIQVKVYEKSRGVGGRLANKRLEWGSIDIGAQYFTVSDPRFQQQVLEWQRQGIVAQWDFNPHCLAGSGLTQKTNSTTRFIGIPKMNALTHALAKDIDIEFNTRIEDLSHSANGWMLIAADEKPIAESYDWVVLTLPNEQSKALVGGTAIEHQVPADMHEPCWALALATVGHVENEIQGIFGDNTVSWVSRLSARPQVEVSGEFDDLWMMHFSSDWSKSHGKDTEVDVTKAGTDWLFKTLAERAEKSLRVVHQHKHYWRYARLDSNKNVSAIIADPVSGIASIGAWSAGGRVEGAYLSGVDFVDKYFDPIQHSCVDG